MSGALVLLAVNVAVATLFVIAYATIAVAGPGQGRAAWFSVSWVLGLIAPAADFLAALIGRPGLLEPVAHASLVAALLSFPLVFAHYSGRVPPWRTAAIICGIDVVARAALGVLSHGSLLYGCVYQSGFVLASAFAAYSILRADCRRPALVLGVAFALLAGNFALKPVICAALGPAPTPAGYPDSRYALVSQATTGILLIAAGLALIILVAHRAILQSERHAETDALSGLLNRRGFDRAAQAVMARAASHRRPIAAIMFDLDHFKRINDEHGHAEGDGVIARFATLLAAVLPTGAVVARLGGEEFAVLIDGADLHAAERHARAVADTARAAIEGPLPATTVSGGVAEAQPGEPLSDLLRRADQAAYRAKFGGRDRVCAAEAAPALRPVPHLRAA